MLPATQNSSNNTNRFAEMLEQLKSEYDQLHQEAVVYKMQKDDLEHKVQQQTEEVNLIRQGLYDLQANQAKIKQQYEQDIMRLQRELEQQRLHAHSSGHPPPSSHPPPVPPPTIGQSGSTLFNGIMNGSGPGLVAPAQMPLDPSQQQPGQPGHGYHGPPQSVPPTGSSSAPSPYMNGSGGPPGGQLQQNHSTKRPRIDDGMPPGTPQVGMPIAQPPPSQMYPSNGLPPAQLTQPNQSIGQPGGYMQQKPVIPTLGPDASSSGMPPNGAPGSVQPQKRTKPNVTAPPPGTRPSSKPGSVPTSSSFDMDLDNIPPGYKKEGTDWFALFNPKVPRVLDVDLVHTLEHTSVVCCVKFSSDGRHLATGCNRSAQIYDVTSGHKIAELLDESVEKNGDLYIRSVCFSPDGKLLATGAEDKQIRIWDINSHTIKLMFTGHEQDIYSLDFSRDGELIVSGSGDKTARIWNMVTGENIFKLPVEEASQKDAGVTSVAISPDKRYVAAGSLDKIVRVWDTRTGTLLEKLEGHKDSVYAVAFAPDGATLVSGSLDKTLKLWDMTSLSRHPQGLPSGAKHNKMTFSGHKDFVLSVAVSPDARWIVSGSKDRGVQFWDPNSGQQQFMLQGHKNSVISVALSPMGNKYFATGSGDLRARVWRYSEDM